MCHKERITNKTEKFMVFLCVCSVQCAVLNATMHMSSPLLKEYFTIYEIELNCELRIVSKNREYVDVVLFINVCSTIHGATMPVSQYTSLKIVGFAELRDCHLLFFVHTSRSIGIMAFGYRQNTE